MSTSFFLFFFFIPRQKQPQHFQWTSKSFVSLWWAGVFSSVHDWNHNVKAKKTCSEFFKRFIMSHQKTHPCRTECVPYSFWLKKSVYCWLKERLWLARCVYSPRTLSSFQLWILRAVFQIKCFYPRAISCRGWALLSCPPTLINLWFSSEFLHFQDLTKDRNTWLISLCEQVWSTKYIQLKYLPKPSHDLHSLSQIITPLQGKWVPRCSLDT